MFDNIGGKIKGLAQVVCWIGIVCFCISGIAVVAEGALFVGILMAAVGSLISWVSSFVLYGFGQLIENSDNMVYYLHRSVKPTPSEMPSATPSAGYSLTAMARERATGVSISGDFWFCTECGEKNSAHTMYCKNCGKYK